MRPKRTVHAIAVAALTTLAVVLFVSCSSPPPASPTPTVPPPTPTQAPVPSPTPALADTPTPEPLVHVVESGDTLSDIAIRYDTTVEAIMELNGLSDTMIFPGTELRIPAGEGTSPPPAAPEPTEAVAPAPPEAGAPTATSAPAPPPPAGTTDWAGFCQPSPQEEGKIVANLQLGSTVRLDAHLYVKQYYMKDDGMIPFTLRETPYQSGDTDWINACQIHLLIPVGTGPNHVKDLPNEVQMGQVVVWDASGREIQGWQRSLDSFHVSVVGVVVETYGGDTGLGGSNTIQLQEIQLLDG